MTEAVEYPDLVVVGAGLFGLTVAQQAVERLGVRVEIIDVRDHIGGNAYSYMDEETGAEIHKYGAHLFHTSNKRVWDYVNRFTSFTNYVHRVYATHDGEVYPLPINLGTINQFFRAHYTPAEAKALVAEQAGELEWRTVDFKEVRYDEGDHFGCPVMNFSDADVPYTRAIEFKNFNPERAASQNPDRTVVWEEYSRFAERGDEPYYPINTEADKALYARYEELAKAEPKTVFGGRLGTYKYYDMHNVIDTALTAYEEQVEPLLKK